MSDSWWEHVPGNMLTCVGEREGGGEARPGQSELSRTFGPVTQLPLAREVPVENSEEEGKSPLGMTGGSIMQCSSVL